MKTINKKSDAFCLLLTAVVCTVLVFCPPNTAKAKDEYHSRTNYSMFEPTVSKAESTLLNRVMDTAQTDTEQAITMLKSGITHDSSPALDFALGNFYFQQNNLELAQKAYETALKKMPKFRSAIMNLGRVYLLSENTAAAIGLYQSLAADGQADADIYTLLGHALMIEKFYVSAESAYRHSLLLDRKQDEAMTGLAKSLIIQERYEEGLALVTEILSREPRNRELWAIVTNAYLSMGKQDAAAQSIEQAHRLGCADPEMLATLGDLYLNQMQPEDALKTYNLAFSAKFPSVQRILRAAEGFLMTGNPEDASKMLERLNSLKKDQLKGYENAVLRLRGAIAQHTGKKEQALDFYKQILKTDPLDGRTMLLICDLQREKGQLEDALITCERTARIEGFEADALIRQAQIEVARRHYEKAAALLEASLAFEDNAHVKKYLTQVKRMIR